MTVQSRQQRSAGQRLICWLGGTLLLLALLVVLLVINNNYSLRRPPRAEFDAQLDRALDGAINWIKDNPVVSERNATMMYMIAQMQQMSQDPRLQVLLDDYQKEHLTHPAALFDLVWLRIMSPTAAVPMIRVPDMQDNVIDFVWQAYALAPDRILLSDEDRANMFSPTKYYWGTRQKQLLALDMYRDYNGSSPDLDATINHLADRVARDEYYDFRFTDSYVQRIAFVLAARRPDLIRQRWIERLLEFQNPNGSWYGCWYGWCRGVFEFNPGYKMDMGGLGHSTVQAAWALTMLKYRYPQWIAEHYH